MHNNIRVFLSCYQVVKLLGSQLFAPLLCVLFLCSPSLAQPTVYIFPLQVSENGRYLVDQKGSPFFYLADTGWQLFNKLTKQEAERYLEDRKQKGFTAIQVQIISHFPAQAVTREGSKAFHNNDLATPNDAYFDHVDWVLAKAQEKGFLMVLSSAWFGYKESGWYKSINEKNIVPYAQFLADKFKKYNHIIWIHGGDCKPGVKTKAINRMASILQKQVPYQLQTVHNGWNGASIDDFGNQSWLHINMTVAVDPIETYSSTLDAYRLEHPKPLPVIMGEPPYENERTDDYGLRSRAYWTMLSGAAGFAYGVIPVWNFEKGWQEALQAPGGIQMGYMKKLLNARNWHELIPDQGHDYVVAGIGKYGTAQYCTAAYLSNNSLVMAYLPENFTISVNLTKMKHPVKAQWFDPTNGAYIPIEGSPFANQKVQAFTPQDFNAKGGRDWVLVLESDGK